MSSVRDIEDLFGQLIELETPVARERFLDDIAAKDASLRDQLEKLIESHQKAGSFLISGQLDATIESSDSVEMIGETVGPYKLLQQLGEGGMGMVYLAERERPVKQRVALKIIKHGMDSKKFIARFEAERQALAMMDHPNIAKVLDAGCTDTGRPYFVMELVKGIPISEFCDENRLTTKDRLELFVQVCQAVHHAHQKGIIHRDIKPSNVLVALYDQNPVPKVIDFGVAKATNQQLTEKTLFTEVGSILGTWEYMSPEQAVLNQLDVDTRTDVYSLGVLLYELLTGETPLDRQKLRTSHLMETLRMIREEEPLKPSTRVSSLGQRATATAAYRKTKPESLAREIRGDLDWIVMKALAKERSRRYDSASRLAEDVGHLLNNEIVEARPPSIWYQWKKTYLRNRGLLNSVGVILVILSMALAYSMRAEARARNEADRAAKALADRNEKNSELETTIEGFNNSLIEMCLLYAVLGDVEKVNELLQGAPSEFPRYWRLTLLGLAHLHHGQNELAVDVLRKAVDENQKNVSAKALLTLALVHSGRWAEWSSVMAELIDVKPDPRYRDFDELFLGYAWFYLDYDASHRRIQEVVDRNPSWHIAHAMLANAGAHVAEHNGDEDKMFEAIKQNQVPEQLLTEENRFALMMCFYVYRTAIVVFDDDDPNRTEYLSKADTFAKQLERYPEYAVGTLVLSVFHEAEDRREQAVDLWRTLLRHGRGMFFHWAGAGLLMDGKERELLNEPRLASFNDVESKTALAYILALSDDEGDRREADSIYSELLGQADTWLERGLLIQIPLLLGEPELARKQARSWLEDEKQPPLTDHFERQSSSGLLGGAAVPMIHCIAEVDHDWSSAADDDRWVQWFLKWQTGLKNYALGETEKAVAVLSECTHASGVPRCWVWYAEGFKARFEQELPGSTSQEH